MRTEIRNNGETDVTVLIADDGYILKRIGSEETFGKEIYLGFSYYIDGILQDPPHADVPSDFCEVEAPEEEEIIDEPEISDEQALEIITEGV